MGKIDDSKKWGGKQRTKERRDTDGERRYATRQAERGNTGVRQGDRETAARKSVRR